jgi:RND family efflux transporter MFP subunit
VKSLITFLLSPTLLLLLALSACSPPPAPPPSESLPTVPVQIITANTGVVQATESVVGTVRAKTRASIQARISARIEQLHVAPGQHVRAGDLLVELDARDIQARLDHAHALQLQAQQDLQRFSALLHNDAVTRAEFDAVQTRFNVAQASATEAEIMLDYSRIVAPFSGVITRKYVDVGDLATPGRPLLDLEDPLQLRFEAHVPDSLFPQIAPGSLLPLHIPTLNLDLSGTVTEIDPATDPISRTSLVKLDLPTAHGLRPGQFGRLLVPTSDRAALRIPASALIQRGQLELIFVVQNNHARLRLVKTGKHWDDQVELLSGIQPGESIVATNPASLHDGQPVTVTP